MQAQIEDRYYAKLSAGVKQRTTEPEDTEKTLVKMSHRTAGTDKIGDNYEPQHLRIGVLQTNKFDFCLSHAGITYEAVTPRPYIYYEGV